MSERKVLNKYYPPDYDPSKVPRIKKKDKKPDVVRIMAPTNMKCKTCGNYIARATKFNAKKETIEGDTYNGLKIYRFHIKCPRCMGSISFRTDLKTGDYVVDQGATENFMALKMAERQAVEEAEAEKEEEKIDPMKQLENRTKASRQQMEASDQIQSIRTMKQRMHSIDIESVIRSKKQESEGDLRPIAGVSTSYEDEIRAESLKLLKRKAIEMDPSSKSSSIETVYKKTTTSEPRLSSSLSALKKIKLRMKPKDTKT